MRRFLHAECGAGFKFDRPFMQWIKDGKLGRGAVERPGLSREIGPEARRRHSHPGAAQGIGAALLEEFVYDASRQPQSVILADYLMPTIAEIPTIEVKLFEDAPTPLNPLGVKGAGEAGIAAAGAAIAAAVDDVLGRPGAVRQLPITPNRLHALLAELPA